MSSSTIEPTWSRTDRARAAAKLMLGWVALLWVLEAVDHATGHALDQYGVVARDPDTLPGVVTGSFLHFGFDHVASNSVPLLVLGFIAALSGIRRFLAVCGIIIVAEGLGTWLISPPNTMTLGASGGRRPDSAGSLGARRHRASRRSRCGGCSAKPPRWPARSDRASRR
ncbi:rhomboid family intramembrane serine protease [Streptomyces sp. enrichment culture]|uniref:rhomboid family intramembrane serine protease n=1 Tax=Streptomyces sp. enrichment culture TaxID=1795815 RepID=UPI003F55CB9C